MKRAVCLGLCALALLLPAAPARTAWAAQARAMRTVNFGVRDGDGKPVPGLHLLVLAADGEGYETRGEASLPEVTDGDGAYGGVAYEVGRGFVLTLENFYASPVQKQTLPFQVSAGQGPLQVRATWEGEHPQQSLAKTADKLILRFVDERGAPVKGLFLSGGRENAPRPKGEKTSPGTDGQMGYAFSDGSYVMVNPARDTYTVSVYYPPAPMGDAPRQSFSFPYQGGSREYTLPLLEEPGPRGDYADPGSHPLRRVMVRVIGPAGEPVPEVVVSGSPASSGGKAAPPLRARKVNRGGLYEDGEAATYTTYRLRLENNLLSPPYALTYNMFIEPYQGIQLRTAVFDGEPPLDTLDKISDKALLYFTHQGPAGQEPAPVPRLRVAVRPAAGGAAVSEGWTDYEGKYLLRGCPPGAYLLEVADEAANRREQYTIDFPAQCTLTRTFPWPYPPTPGGALAESRPRFPA